MADIHRLIDIYLEIIKIDDYFIDTANEQTIANDTVLTSYDISPDRACEFLNDIFSSQYESSIEFLTLLKNNNADKEYDAAIEELKNYCDFMAESMQNACPDIYNKLNISYQQLYGMLKE